MEKEPLLQSHGGRGGQFGTGYDSVDLSAHLVDSGSSSGTPTDVGSFYDGGGGPERSRTPVVDVSVALSASSRLAYNREPGGISNAEAVLHMIKGNIGTGVIGLPYAFMFAGFGVGLASMTFISVIAISCMLMLVRASHHLCDLHSKKKLDYADTAYYAMSLLFPASRWAKFARGLINAFLIVTQLGFTAIYFVFIAKNMQQVLSAMTFSLGYEALVFIFVPVMIAGVCIRDLKTTAIFSGIGNVLQIISILIIIIYVSLHLEWDNVRQYPKEAVDMALFFGLATFSVEGIGVVMPLENDMKRPRMFPSVLVGSMSFVCTLFLLVGSLGFLCFRDETLGSITLNLPGGSDKPENIPFLYVKLFYTFSIMASHLVQFYVAIEIIEPMAFKNVAIDDPKRPYYGYALRAALTVGAAGLAAVVPDLGLFISLVGAAGSSGLAIIFPPLIHLAAFWREAGVLWKVRNVAIALVGIIGMVTGTYATVMEIIETM